MKCDSNQRVAPDACSFRLDAINQCAWLGSDLISLSPKAFRVLLYLAERPGKLVTKEELLDRFQSLQVQDGTYEPMGPNRILIKRRVSQFPQNHNTEQVMEWKVTGDQLSLTIISDTGSAPVGQISTYKRLKK